MKNLLSVDTAMILSNVFEMIDLEVQYEELSSIDYDMDYQAIYNILHMFITIFF